MSTFISKSLFVEFCDCPMLARYHRNDKLTYTRINDQQYGAMDGIAIGQEVEDVVAQLWNAQAITSVDTKHLDFKDWHASYHRETMRILEQQPAILYQAGFVSDNLFCKVDFLVRNAQGTYDIVEVKSKSSIRTKTKKAPLIADLEADISFQDHVVRAALGDRYSGNISLAYLDKTYTKAGAIDPRSLIIIEDVTAETMDGSTIHTIIESINRSIDKPKSDFQRLYPYSGEYPLIYFGEKPAQGSIFTIPRITSSKRKLIELYDDGKKMITDLDHDDLEFLSGGKPESPFVKFVELYRQGKTVDAGAIGDLFDQTLQYPLYFYDYETVTNPVPLFEQSSPRQQVIVQYSLHKIDADGTVTHREGLIEHGETDNKRVIDSLITDLTQTSTGTYIVWYQGFENSRNTEAGLMYPSYAAAFEHINTNTFDLMDIFKDLLYFDPAFCGSSSIKKVLPTLTDISYSGLAIGNGGAAADALGKLAKGSLTSHDADSVKDNLLRYCRQDTWAMVRIWQTVCEEIGYEIPELKGDVG